jgi:hypothetical protein
MVVSCLIKILFVAGQDSNLHELYSVLVSTFTGIIVIIFTELAGLSYLAAYFVLQIFLIIHSRPITLAYASTPSGLINHPSFKIGILLYKVHLVLQVRTVLWRQRNKSLSYSTNLALPHASGYLDSAL